MSCAAAVRRRGGAAARWRGSASALPVLAARESDDRKADLRTYARCVQVVWVCPWNPRVPCPSVLAFNSQKRNVRAVRFCYMSESDVSPALVRYLCKGGCIAVTRSQIRRSRSSWKNVANELRHVGVSADTRTDLATSYHCFAALAYSATMRRARYYYNCGCPPFYVAHHGCGCIKAREARGCKGAAPS